MDEIRAIELITGTPLLRYENEINASSELGKAMLMGVEALKAQQKIKEKIEAYKQMFKRNPWEEVFVGEIIKLLEGFLVEE